RNEASASLGSRGLGTGETSGGSIELEGECNELAAVTPAAGFVVGAVGADDPTRYLVRTPTHRPRPPAVRAYEASVGDTDVGSGSPEFPRTDATQAGRSAWRFLRDLPRYQPHRLRGAALAAGAAAASWFQPGFARHHCRDAAGDAANSLFPA